MVGDVPMMGDRWPSRTRVGPRLKALAITWSCGTPEGVP
jgi:hypothetical protein